MQYQDMIVEAFSPTVERTPDKRRLARFQVRVRQSPAGSMPLDQAQMIEYDDKAVTAQMTQLETRSLTREGLVVFGRLLGQLVLPSDPQSGHGVRELFAQSIVMLGPDRGLRLKLQLPGALALLPWEYLYIDQAGGGGGMDGFLALDRRVAIVRHEDLPAPPRTPLAPAQTKMIIALASAAGFPALDLAKERADLTRALQEMPGVTPIFLDDATLDDLQPAITGATVFHFAGHGVFRQQMGEQPGSYTGVGQLAFDDQHVDAPELGILLRGAGVQLAVLGGCETGRRDGVSVWSGTASALLKAQIPAVVANQFKVLDMCALAFSKQFYQALLVGGLSIEQAVSAGRIAAYLADREGRDWGAAVLYMRAADGRLFGGIAEEELRRKAVQEAEELVMTVNITGGVGFIGGDKIIHGDEVHGDKLDARGSQGLINQSSGSVTQVYGDQHNINTGGGDHAEGAIDKRQGSFIQGDQINMPGNFSGAILNIKSTLAHVKQMLGATARVHPNEVAELQQLTNQLVNLLQKAPPQSGREAEILTKRVESLLEAATDVNPDAELVMFNAERLRRSTATLADELPDIQPLCDQIGKLACKMNGIA